MPKPVIESKKPSEHLTIEETCRPELARMSDAEMNILQSLKGPIKRIAMGMEKDRELVEDALDQAENTKGGPKKREQRMAQALHTIADVYNADESLEQFRHTIRDIDVKLGQVIALRKERMERLQKWISELSGTQEQLGAKLGETRQEARRGDIAATFQLQEIERELGTLGDTILNNLYPELQAEQSQEVISQEELKMLETRIEGILARIQSLLAPPAAPKRVTGPLSKKQERWAEGAYRQ